MKTRIIKISRELPSWKAISVAANIVDSGGIICFPTDTTYGFGASVYCPDAIRRLRGLKSRKPGEGFVIVVSDMGMVLELVKGITHLHKNLMNAYWPGPLTLVFEASPRVPSYLISKDGTVALRIPNDSVTQAVLRACGTPLAAPSANPRGKSPAISPDEVLQYFEGRFELLLDGGVLESAEPSTIVAVGASHVRVLRRGRVGFGGYGA